MEDPLKSMKDYLRIRGYAQSTQENYALCVRVISQHFHIPPLDISGEHVASFILHLREQKKSDSTVHMYYEAIRMFLKIHNLDNRLPTMTFRRIRNKIPYVPSQERVLGMLASCQNLKYRTIYSFMYSAGLRVSELKNLTINDIDLERNQVYIRGSKNQKSRYSVIGWKTITLIKAYMDIYEPAGLLFFSRDQRRVQMSTDTIRREFKKLLTKVGMDTKGIHLHTLRHCFATHLAESGTSIFHIMQLLGHANISTTMRYLHAQDIRKMHITSPIDSLEVYEQLAEDVQRQLFSVTA